MGRVYQVTFGTTAGISITAAQDLVLIAGGEVGLANITSSAAAPKVFRILRHWLSCSGASALLTLRSRLLIPGASANFGVVAGTGGVTGITPNAKNNIDAACSTALCGTNNTTKAKIGTGVQGTFITTYMNSCLSQNGDYWTYTDPPIVGTIQGFVYELLSTSTVTATGGVEFEEIG